MKVATEIRNIDLTGTLDTKEFTIKVGHHIMSILSGLYTDPTDAIVREYLTNMNDAYIALFRENPSAPFIPPAIHAPSEMAPYVEFRDYGVGMPDDVVWNVFTQYGNSTKNSNNDEVGGFGIGSKTAFCYNNGSSWSIESRYKGIVNRYIAFVNDKQIPTLTLVSSEPTNDPSGVTINIPVLRHDIASVRSAIQKYAPHFPRELTLENITPEPMDILFQGTSWKLIRGKSGNGPAQVIMGNVPYPIEHTVPGMDAHFLMNQGVSRSVATLVNKYRGDSSNLYLLMTLPVGTVDIVPSRDGLKYSDRTKAALYSAMKVVSSELTKVVEKSIASAKDVREAHKLFVATRSILPDIKEVNYEDYRVVYDGWVVPAAKLPVGLVMSVAASYAPERGPVDLTSMPGACFVHHCDGDTIIMINDIGIRDRDAVKAARVARGLCNDRFMGKTATGRISKYVRRAGEVYTVKNGLYDAATLASIFCVPSNAIVTATAIMPTVILKADAKEASVYRWNRRDSWSARVKMPKGNGPFYYVPLVKTYSGRYGNSKLERVVKSAVNFDNATGVTGTYTSMTMYVYGVKPEDIASLGPEWKNLFEEMKRCVAAELPNYTTVRQNAQTIVASDLEWLPSLVKALGGSAPADLKVYSDAIETRNKAQSTIAFEAAKMLVGLAQELDLTPPATTPKDIAKEGKALHTKYPILTVIHTMCVGTRYQYSNVQFPSEAVKAILKLL